MPITGPSSYIPTTDLFLSHWLDVNAVLGAAPLLVGVKNPAGGVPLLKTRADLDTLRAALVAARGLVTTEAVTLSVRREETRDLMTALLARFNQFNAAVRSRYMGRAFARSLPDVPSMGDSPDTFAGAAQKAETLWLLINATLASAPLLLGAGTIPDPSYALAAFTLDLAAIRAASAVAQASEQRLKTRLETRNDVQDEISPLLRDYRQAVASRFPGDHAFLASLPRYSPPPGNKPDSPEITSAAWNALTTQADITFTPSTSNDVENHELRICPGSEYDADLETVDATLAVGQPPVFHSASLLGSPGAIVSYKIYAITNDERENDSEPATVQRPAA